MPKRPSKSMLNKNTAEVRESVFDREQYRCRIPWCEETAYEMAHLADKGMGGDHGLRTTTANCVAVCTGHHRGTRSLHSGHLKFEFLSSRGADGPIRFSYDEQIGRFQELQGDLRRSSHE